MVVKPSAVTFASVVVLVTVNVLCVPILVIYGCALVLSVPATSVNAPVAPLMLPVVILPVTVNDACVPMLVMYGCAFVSTRPCISTNVPFVALTAATLMLPVRLANPAVMFVNVPVVPLTLPVVTLPETCAILRFALVAFRSRITAPFAVMFAVVTTPVTVNEANVPILVIFGWALVISVPLILPKLAVPLTLIFATEALAVKFKLSIARVDPAPPSNSKLPTVTVPLTVKLPSVPTFVINGWLPVAIVPVIFPPTARLPNVPIAVILGWLAVCNVPSTVLNVPLAPLTLPVVTLPAIANAFGVVHTPSYMVKLPYAPPWPIKIPEPRAAVELTAPLASVRSLSLVVTLPALTVVVLPFTNKLPVT